SPLIAARDRRGLWVAGEARVAVELAVDRCVDRTADRAVQRRRVGPVRGQRRSAAATWLLVQRRILCRLSACPGTDAAARPRADRRRAARATDGHQEKK